eukprot:CAMPEP_0196744594 /NCGR_PEP_ID=MMETSP1091-20130531/58221_1 /TAXON_ID=302021 /ORGANISM="Rhodomonas sp., Strain CCMP768" /LENGTH=35 /DNA_ID= /DNA_START= /DNA_END= /DNA_ORIENTATION=
MNRAAHPGGRSLTATTTLMRTMLHSMMTQDTKKAA